jgi:hypothetical protein
MNGFQRNTVLSFEASEKGDGLLNLVTRLLRTQDTYLIIWYALSQEVPPGQFEHLDRNFNTPVGFHTFHPTVDRGSSRARPALSGAALDDPYARYQRRRSKLLDTRMSIAGLNVACTPPSGVGVGVESTCS